MESNKTNKVEPGRHTIKVYGKKPSVGNWEEVTPEGKESYWTLVVDDKEDEKDNPYGDVDPKKMERDWERATSEEGRPPIGGAKDD